jgi:hypothetical protein
LKQDEQYGKEAKYILTEGFPVYESREALEEARLREAVNRTDTEKFRLFTRMMRISMMMKKAKITYQPE